MTEATEQVGRIAMRQEGNLWVGRYAEPHSMEDAVFLGSIQLALVHDPELKKVFLALLEEGLTLILNGKGNGEFSFESEPTPAPEHERAGNA